MDRCDVMRSANSINLCCQILSFMAGGMLSPSGAAVVRRGLAVGRNMMGRCSPLSS